MKTKNFVLLLLLEIPSNFSHAAEYSYKKNGDDWPETYKNCSGSTQSPIDLPVLGGNNKISIISYSEDKFVKKY